MGFPGGSDSKESACNEETRVWSLGWEDPLEKGMATHSNILAWGIPWTEEPGGPQSMGLKRVGHNWATFTCTPSSSHRRRPLSRGILWCLSFQTLETSGGTLSLRAGSLPGNLERQEPSVRVTHQTVLLVSTTHSSTWLHIHTYTTYTSLLLLGRDGSN